MPPLGIPAADFHLPDVVSGATVSLASFAGKRALLVMFLSRHCPYVQHVKKELARIGRDYAATGLGIVAISSNYVVEYPDDAPERLREMAAELESASRSATTRRRKWRKLTTRRARPTFFCSTRRGISCIAASWMARGRRTTFR